MALVAISGCAGWRHGSTEARFEGQILRVGEGSPGLERLEIESNYDTTFRDFMGQHGQPDYIYIGDRYSVQLVYVSANFVVLFQRPTLNSHSEATVTFGIPYGLALLLTDEDRDRIADGSPAPPK